MGVVARHGGWLPEWRRICLTKLATKQVRHKWPPPTTQHPVPVPPRTTQQRFVQTESLQALREVIDAGGKVRRVVARRAGLGESELVALQHLILGSRGPAEVARLLEVSTAASTGIVDRLVAHGHVERRPHPRRPPAHGRPRDRRQVARRSSAC